ncbi:MAG: DNA polymerase III subunit gamma/tau [Chloroflexi bacterium]|nr:DNA polymerase III subunit gamma/tau [Chloroflexota bacterium]
MSYQVIARKYRPQRFAEVVGQEHVTQTLSHAIQQSRIAHAYLFVGPRGTGKTTIARIFAKCLNCTGGPKLDFADDDPRAQEITEGRALDVLEIDGASNRGIEEIRDLREAVKYAPATSRFKIYIIDEVHMLTKEAFNALLKTLEEPPEHVKFMFATTEPEKVLPTILSRCQRFDLRRIPSALIVGHLARIAVLEQVQIDEAGLHAIARGAEGCMRDAESTLDQLISFCGNQIVEADVLSMFGLTSRSQVFALARDLLEGRIETALRDLNDLAKNGKDLGRLLTELLNHFRNLLIYQVSRGDLRLLEVSDSEASTLAEQSALASQETLTRVMEVLAEGEGRFRDAASKKILLEITLLKAIQARQAVSVDSILNKLRQLREENATSGVAQPAALPASVPAPAPASVPASSAEAEAKASLPQRGAAGGLPKAAVLSAEAPAGLAPSRKDPRDAGAAHLPTAEAPVLAANAQENLEAVWLQIVEAVGRASPFARTYLLEAHPVSFAKNVFTIGFDPEFADHLGLVDNPKNRNLIQTKLRELGLGDAQVRFIQAEAPANRASRAATEPAPTAREANAPAKAVSPTEPKAEKAASTGPSKEDFKNDPLIKKALEIFKGQIVEVRS